LKADGAEIKSAIRNHQSAVVVVRLQKFLADAGVASRRAGEQIILAGRVSVNAQPVRLLGTKVDPDHDQVAVDGKLVHAKKLLYIALNKPAGCVCSRKDELDRPTIYELLPREWNTIQSVGRLDYNSEGLIFLTNDGQFALRLTHPRYGIRKKYLATVEGEVTPAMLQLFRQGVFHEGERLKALAARIISGTRAKSVVELEMGEGKNREVRRLFESQALTVKKLQRTQIGKIRLGELKPGKWRTLNVVEIKTLISDL
jgi:pseudouridine synthase